MKKALLLTTLLFFSALFISCDNGINGLLELFTGNATSVINGGSEDNYTSSIIMFNDNDDPAYAIGLATTMEATRLIHLSGTDELVFPFLSYRLVHDNLSANTRLEISTPLTNEEIASLDYRGLLDGSFSQSHLLCVAKSPTLFYIMRSGTITITKVKETKVEGNYSGMAYVVNLENDPALSDELVTISGSFSSKVIPMMDWILTLQNEEEQTNI